ncbi:MAG: class I SAM-dependent RNA methyltransferase [Salinarimonadaceae bacterium]|nr:MAG: class I SAM-dependent RNA methyltransferase [Salinarimonadaceae bacterium]
MRITRLGARGDGVADTPDGALFVPFALPGELVALLPDGKERALGRARIAAGENAIRDASPHRLKPFCPHFGFCGGCATQHMGEALYHAWKRDALVSALAGAGIDAPVGELVDARGAGRRRVTFHGRLSDGAMQVGFMAARSHDLVPIDVCPAAEPGLALAAPAARTLTGALRRSAKPLDIQVTATMNGLDVDLRGHGPLKPPQEAELIRLAAALDLARLSLHGQTLVERRPPHVAMGRALVAPPPGGFLQATAAGEEILARLVVEALTASKRKIKRVADLFSGCGPFALRVAGIAGVHAVENDAGAIAALERAARATQGLRAVTSERRDLFRRPLLAPELNAFDAVILDPPRAGCEAQARRIAESRVPLVVSVSCDAGSFARDAAIMIAGGYRLESVTPVDQFAYTGHLEIVGVLRR